MILRKIILAALLISIGVSHFYIIFTCVIVTILDKVTKKLAYIGTQLYYQVLLYLQKRHFLDMGLIIYLNYQFPPARKNQKKQNFVLLIFFNSFWHRSI